MTLRALYRQMTDRDLRALREAFRSDRAARPDDRKLQAFATYRIDLINTVLKQKGSA